MKRRHFLAGLALPLAGVMPATVRAASDPAFDSWLANLRQEAAQKGFSRRTIDSALTGLAPIDRVIELDRKQPEVTLTFNEYLTRVVNDARAQTGRVRIRENDELLQRVSARYGVQPRFIVALWAIETDFGRITGGFPIIEALATLAYEGRRAQFFRDELFNALRIVEKNGIAPRDMRGSWAGAMGQSQFMPSSYLRFAADFDGDGKADIWTSRPDVFASIANYLSSTGWRNDETWGREAKLPAGFDPAHVDDRQLRKTPRALSEWTRLGVRRADGGPLPTRDIPAWVILPGGDAGPAFLVYANYKTLLNWNRSLFFATAVGHLADRLGET